MLGLYPIGSRAISSGPFGLVAVPAAAAATVAFAFALSAHAGAIVPLSAQVTTTFAINARLFVDQAISATVSFAFDGSPLLRVAGRPIKLSALPLSYTLRATQQEYTLKALPTSFDVRGVK